MSSLADRYSQASRRGRAVGMVTAGISVGLVLSRVLGGRLGNQLGRRAMLRVSAAACLGLALAATAVLPLVPMRPAHSYRAVIRMLPDLLRSNRQPQTSAVTRALRFFPNSLQSGLGRPGRALTLARPPA